MTDQPVTVAEVEAFAQRLIAGGLADDDAARVDEIRALERLKCVAEGRQARETAAFDASQRQRAAEAGVPRDRQGRGIGHQVGLARRESPHKGQSHAGLAVVLHREMPYTKAALVAGRITEWRAMVLVRETACLPLEHRQTIDHQLAGDPAKLEAMSDRDVLGQVRRLAARLDPAAVAERRRRAEADRNVSIRPAPDSMAFLTALLPVADAVAAYAALKQEADRAVGVGEATSRGQVMADTLVARVTGQAASDPVPVEVNLFMTDSSLFRDNDTDEVHVDDCGPIPPDLARELVEAAVDTGDAALRRVFTSPATGELVGMESIARTFPKGLGRLIRVRDRFCRHQWCNAPIRHTDHITPHSEGGPTSFDNGQGLCESCNHAKQAPGWNAKVTNQAGHTVETTTPTGHTYESHAPPITGPPQAA